MGEGTNQVNAYPGGMMQRGPSRNLDTPSGLSVGQESHVSRELGVQKETLSRLEEIIELLATRLTPVLGISTPENDGNKAPLPLMAPVAEAIWENTSRITRASANLSQIIKRLEV